MNFSLPPSFTAETAGLFISPGWGIHPDRVINTHELIFMRSGTLHIEEDGVEFSLEPFSTLILYPGRRHRGVHAYSDDTSFYWIHFQPSERISQQSDSISTSQHSLTAHPERLTELFHRYLDDQESDTLLPSQGGLIVAQMLLEVSRKPHRLDGLDTSLAGRAQRYIDSHFLKGIHAGDVATFVGCHPDYLGRLYKRISGHTLSESIHRKQIAEARRLLRESTLNIEEISLACGFKGSRYFRELFTQSQGMTPRAYRNLYARIAINYR